MNRTEIKHTAQQDLLAAMGVAFARLAEESYNDATKAALEAEMSVQMARVEKLFGYDPYSCLRGV